METPSTDNERRLNAGKRALWRSLRFLCPPTTDPNGQKVGGYEVDDNNAAALLTVAQWMVADPTGPAHPDRGLFLRGPVGTGKSDLMRGLSAAMVSGGGDGFPVVPVKRIVYEYSRTDERMEQGPAVIMRYAALPVLCIDDLGTEEDGKHYGKTVNAVADLLAFRYDRWRQGAGITHITTNLDNAALAARYDERTVSRIMEMTTVVPMPGRDRRTDSTPRPVERKRLFDDDERADVLPTEQAMQRLAELKRTVDRVAAEKSAKEQDERDAAPSRSEVDMVKFKAALMGMDLEQLRLLRDSEHLLPRYADAVCALIIELEQHGG